MPGQHGPVRAVVQRVTQARVTVLSIRSGEFDVVGEIGPGLCVLVGVTHDDNEANAAKLADKILNLRVMADQAGVMNRSVSETGGQILIVSQFTLYGDTRKGRRPSFVAAARPEVAEPLVDHVIEAIRARGTAVATGRFGADMRVELANDGPVTLVLDV